MLTRYCLELTPDRSCTPGPEWGYRLYAVLLERAPKDFGIQVHQMNISPISQFLDCRARQMKWVISLLGNQAEEAFGDLLESPAPLRLTKDEVMLSPVLKNTDRIADPDEMFFRAAQGSGRHVLQFRTPTAFKSRGNYQILPTSRLILQNLINKWNGCFSDCMIEDEDGEGIEAMADGLVCRRFQLHDQRYFLKGNSIPGFVGTLTLDNQLKGFHRELVDMLLTFAGYAGVGIKTSLGMGGVEHRTEA